MFTTTTTTTIFSRSLQTFEQVCSGYLHRTFETMHMHNCAVVCSIQRTCNFSSLSLSLHCFRYFYSLLSNLLLHFFLVVTFSAVISIKIVGNMNGNVEKVDEWHWRISSEIIDRKTPTYVQNPRQLMGNVNRCAQHTSVSINNSTSSKATGFISTEHNRINDSVCWVHGDTMRKVCEMLRVLHISH